MIGISLLMVALTVLYVLFKYDYVNINALLITMTIGLFVIGVLLILINVPAYTAMMKIIDKDKFGKVSSIGNIGSQGLIPLGTFLAGLALNYIGSIGLLSICAGGLLLTSLILFFVPPVREI